MSQPESRLSRKIITELMSKGVFAFKVHGGAHMMAGLPDIIVCLEGRFYGLEVKLPGREQNTSPTQVYVHDKIEKSGGRVFVVTTVRAALESLELI